MYFFFHLNLTTTFSLQINMVIVIESSNFSKFSCSKYYGQILLHFVFSKLIELHCNMLITNLIFIFSIFCSIFLVCNYINNIYLFQKLSIFLSFREVQIWLIQLPYCEANFANLYITVQMLWLIYKRAGKIRCMLVLCPCLSPKVSSRRMKECVPKLFMSSDLSSL